MDFLTQLYSFLFGVKRTFLAIWKNEDYDFQVENLLGASFYNFGELPVKIYGFELRAYDANRGPDVYVLDTLPITYEKDLIIPIKFTGSNARENKVYITYSALRKC